MQKSWGGWGRAMPVPHPVPTDKAGEEQETHLAPLSTNGKASRVSNISSAAPWPRCPPCKEFLLCHLCQGLSARLLPGMVWARKVWQPWYFSSHEDNLEGCPSCLLCPQGRLCKGLLGPAWIWVTRSLFWLSLFGHRFEEVLEPFATSLACLDAFTVS